MTLPDTYQAWTWQTGHIPQDLQLQTIACRPLPAHAVLVRNEAIGLNPVDWKVLGRLDTVAPGHVPGVDGAGIVVAVGEGVAPEWVGQRVAYHQNLHVHGSFAQYTPLAVRALLRLPDALDFATAASFPCPGLTAWLAIEKIPARSGACLLISGAGGAVGLYLVQLALARGFSVHVRCHPRHWSRLLALGVAQCHDTTNTLSAADFYAVIDSTGPEAAMQLSHALEANGHLVCIQGRVSQWPFPGFEQAISLHEVALGALHRYGNDAAWARLIAAGETLLANISAGSFQAEPQLRRDFSVLPQFLEELRQRSFSGKPIILFK
jgi:NADPH:quinone reductase-like Zn-dependent oxidoreductase